MSCVTVTTVTVTWQDVMTIISWLYTYHSYSYNILWHIKRVILLEQLGRRAKHFKSPGNPKSIVQKITKLYTYLQEILKEQNRKS